jgi:hypothetical protein
MVISPMFQVQAWLRFRAKLRLDKSVFPAGTDPGQLNSGALHFHATNP